jgi:dihydrofolate reductase
MSVYNKLTTIYAARSIDGGFGMSDGSLPWTCPQDLDLFAKITKHTNSRFRNTMFMGTTTFSEIGDLPGRHIIQVSKQIKTPELLWMENGGIGYSDQVFIAGGKKLFSSVFESGFRPDCIILSTIERECPHADIFLRDSDLHLDQYVLFSFKQFDGFRVHVYVKNTDHPKIPSGVLEFVPHHDQMYANLVRNILDNGERVQDRTGNGTVRMFAPPPIKFDLGVVFPIITTKRVFWRGVCEELWWFLRGSTDSKELERVGVHIWSGNTSRDFLDQRGLEDYEPGQTGPIYGHQWRHWNGDQLQNLVDGIQRDPFSRRHLLSAWNVGDRRQNGASTVPLFRAIFRDAITATRLSRVHEIVRRRARSSVQHCVVRRTCAHHRSENKIEARHNDIFIWRCTCVHRPYRKTDGTNRQVFETRGGFETRR